MTLAELNKILTDAVLSNGENAITAGYALSPDIVGTPFYDSPLMGCAAADDPLFKLYKSDPKIYGDILRLPEEWLDGAKSVISFFLPYTKAVRDSNIPDRKRPSDIWLHARIEGQAFLEKMTALIAASLEAEGFKAVIPSRQPEFRVASDADALEKGGPVYKSSWSERHAAFVSGLGTFSLAKHIITEKGACGRFGSVITDAYIEPVKRAYTDPYEYCTFCGKCNERCPVKCISVEKGKNNLLCGAYIDKMKLECAPRYGCGKCQQCVPCESGIPAR